MANTTIHDQIERVAKALPLVLAALYVVGFIIVSVRLAGYGASSLDLFRIQYVAAGFFYAIASAFFFLFAAPLRVFMNAYLSDRFEWAARLRVEVRELIGAILGDSLLTVLLIVSLSLSNMSVAKLLWFMFSLVAIHLLIHVWGLRRSLDSDEFGFQFFSLQVIAFTVLAVVASFVLFALDLYPRVSFSIGGGHTRQVVFWLGQQPTPTFLERDGNSEYTVPYELLLETENSFVVISPKDNQRSLEFDRKAVGAMIVLGKRPASAPANFQRNLVEPAENNQKQKSP